MEATGLIGELGVSVRPFHEEDLPVYFESLDRLDLFGPYDHRVFRSRQEMKKEFDEDGFIGKDNVRLVVDVAGRAVGAIGYRPHQWPRGMAPVMADIGLGFWDPSDRGKGYGRAATQLLVDYLFGELHYHRLTAGTHEDNVPARKTLEACGFKFEGISRELFYYKARWHDYAEYALLEDEWRARR
ncbi:MAG: GNAT family protein [Actinomycetota bacterium]